MATRLQQMRQARLQKLEALRREGIDPYPAQVTRTHTNSQALKKDGIKATLVGLLTSWRGHGKLQFADLVDGSAKVQLAFRVDHLTKDQFEHLSLIDPGDFLRASGITFTTNTGERTLEVHDYRLISKAIKPVPGKWYGLKDKEERFRKRYLDLLLNPQVKQVLDKRWQIQKAVREFFWQQGYHEVETPILQNLYGGTNARPFTTHLNTLDIDMYLRIAPELYLKRLVIGGYERVFEIARNFRNEGMDQTHQPEFTMIEAYEAYADYHRIMDITEELFKHLAQTVNSSLKLEVEDYQVDLSGKWHRITIDQALKDHLDLDWDTVPDEQVQQILAKEKLTVSGTYTRAKALFIIFEHLVAPKLVQPTWVIDYPIDVSPLAKEHRTKEGRVERFEGYIAGKEICDGWSEIVSSLDQRRYYSHAHCLDELFCFLYHVFCENCCSCSIFFHVVYVFFLFCFFVEF